MCYEIINLVLNKATIGYLLNNINFSYKLN